MAAEWANVCEELYQTPLLSMSSFTRDDHRKILFAVTAFVTIAVFITVAVMNTTTFSIWHDDVPSTV